MSTDMFSPMQIHKNPPSDSLADGLWRCAISLDPAGLAAVCEKARLCSPQERIAISEAAAAAARSLAESISGKKSPDIPQAALCLLSLARGGFLREALSALPQSGAWSRAAKACFSKAPASDLTSIASDCLRSADSAGLVFSVVGGCALLAEEAHLWACLAIDNSQSDFGQSAYWIGAGYANVSDADRLAAASAVSKAIAEAQPDQLWLSGAEESEWRQSVEACLSSFQKGMLEFGGIHASSKSGSRKSV